VKKSHIQKDKYHTFSLICGFFLSQPEYGIMIFQRVERGEGRADKGNTRWIYPCLLYGCNEISHRIPLICTINAFESKSKYI
jgi:hypothetical protein